jgi:uncharacterized protein DUF6321/uncharacterized protein DUF5872
MCLASLSRPDRTTSHPGDDPPIVRRGFRVPMMISDRASSAAKAKKDRTGKKPVLKDPKGGLTAAGRRAFNESEGANLKPGVKKPLKDMTPEEMKRKGSFLRRHYATLRGPLVDEDGKPTRLALQAQAWGERVPKTEEDAAKLAEKGSKLLDRYKASKAAESHGRGRKSTGSRRKGDKASGDDARKSPEEVYTDPALRDRLKAEIMAGDKGGKPGQWSARKSQLLASEYKKAGGGYRNGKGKKTEAQKDLDAWTDEAWTTADGQPAIRDGETRRYLPREAWDKLTPAQRKATDAKKRAGSKRGKQFVANTEAAAKARKSTGD